MHSENKEQGGVTADIVRQVTEVGCDRVKEGCLHLARLMDCADKSCQVQMLTTNILIETWGHKLIGIITPRQILDIVSAANIPTRTLEGIAGCNDDRLRD